MLDIIYKHPSLHYTQEINDICRPLNSLNISYFSHVHVDNAGKFSAISSNAGFSEHYLKNEYYNADIHMAKHNTFGNYILWDSMEFSGQSEKLHELALGYDIRSTFTIIDKNSNGRDFYHFSTHLKTQSINQIYLSNIDLLKAFISHFHAKVSESKILSSAYDITFGIDTQAKGYEIIPYNPFDHLNEKRIQFLDEILFNQRKHSHSKHLHPNEQPILLHKKTHKPCLLTPQQTQCFLLLVKGYAAKQVATHLNLKQKTVENYLANIKKMLGYNSSKELIAAYYAQCLR